jgi:DNA polymerase-3 subunit alpha
MINGDKWVSLHTHDEFSTLDGINRVSEYPKYCKEILGQKALAQTNHGTLAGAYAFTKSCRQAGINPILGFEAYYCGDRKLREKNEHGKAYYHLILLAKNNNGLKNLFKLSSLASSSGLYYKPRIDDELLGDLSEDLYVSTACLGSSYAQLIMAGDHKAAERSIDLHSRMFPDRFFIELQTHNTPDQQLVNEVLISIASRKNLPLILTADAHYAHPEDKKIHELSLRMNTNADPDDDGFSFGNIECHLAGHDELAAKCIQQNIPYDAIANTVSVAEMVDHASYFSDRKNHFPTFKNLPEDMKSWEYLEALAWGGLLKRMNGQIPTEYRERFYEELRIIKRASGMCDYLLIVWEFLDNARRLDVACGPGRGSGAGSLLCWALEITQVDPIHYGLLFSRFTNEGRLGRPLLF